jgi:hypothetical protein
MADTLGGGVMPVAHTILSPGQEKYREIEAHVPHCGYDPIGAAQLLEASGYRRGSDGALRDRAGERIELEIRSVPADLGANAAAAVAGYWNESRLERA